MGVRCIEIRFMIVVGWPKNLSLSGLEYTRQSNNTQLSLIMGMGITNDLHNMKFTDTAYGLFAEHLEFLRCQLEPRTIQMRSGEGGRICWAKSLESIQEIFSNDFL